jgi:hypothetical protein
MTCMRVWGHGILNVLEAGKDAGWVVAIVLICVGTFAVSSVFFKRGFGRRSHVTHPEPSLKHIR